MDIVRLQSEPINMDEALQALQDESCGGHAIFLGTVRNAFEGRESQGLYYEAYHDLAIKEMERIAEELKREFNIVHGVMIHRVGELGLGEVAVIVATSAPHRVQAIAACQAGIDRIKERVPIWKKERWATGQAHWHHDPANLGETPL